MAVKEISIADKLDALYELQTIDSAIDEIHKMKGELPLEVEDLEDVIEGLKTRVKNIEEQVDELNTNVNNNKQKIKDANALIKKYEKQQSNVKNNREFDALTKEIEMQNLEIQLAEKRNREIGEKIDAEEAYLNESKEALKRRTKDLAAKKVELEKIIKETEKEEKSLQKKSTKAEDSIEERLLRSYNRIRKAYRNGLAVVTVERDSCGGCFAKVPPQRQMEIRQRKKTIVCEHCGRILVAPTSMDAEDEK